MVATIKLDYQDTFKSAGTKCINVQINPLSATLMYVYVHSKVIILNLICNNKFSYFLPKTFCN
jgi:hypothetical protein